MAVTVDVAVVAHVAVVTAVAVAQAEVAQAEAAMPVTCACRKFSSQLIQLMRALFCRRAPQSESEAI